MRVAAVAWPPCLALVCLFVAFRWYRLFDKILKSFDLNVEIEAQSGSKILDIQKYRIGTHATALYGASRVLMTVEAIKILRLVS